MMGFAGMERDTVTGLNLAVNRVAESGDGEVDEPGSAGVRGGGCESVSVCRQPLDKLC